MNRDQVLKIATECGFGPVAEVEHNLDMLCRFATYVVQYEREACKLLYEMSETHVRRVLEAAIIAEREACAKVCESFGEDWHCQSTTNEIAEKIRARDKQ